MSKIIFNYKGGETEIQCNMTEKIKDIFQKYANKIGLDISNIYSLYNGNSIDDNKNVSEIITEQDKIRKIMKILVYDNNKIINKENKRKSKEIICPECYENILIEIDEYKMNFYNCKNNHKIDNLFLNEYENIEKIYLSKIICGNCKNKNMSETYNNEFYRCNICKINLCPLCKSKHNKEHKIINYNNKNYICENHDKEFIKYCKNCKLNICIYCFDAHKNHSIINYEDIMLKEEDIKNEINKLKEYFNKFKRCVKDIKEKLNELEYNMDIYYNKYNNIINNYNCKNINYETINNIKEFNRYNNIIIEDINKIINDKNINNKFNKIINIYNKMNNKNEYHNFENDPNNLKFKIDITNTNEDSGCNDIFEVFISYKDNKEYIISPNKDNYNLDIFTLLDNKIIKSLIGHKNHIRTVRYFLNNKDYNEYLISADENKIVIIWDITNNYNIKYQINTNYDSDIHSCLLVFPHNNNDNYIITSTDSTSNDNDKSATKIYSLNSGNFIKYINNTNNNQINYLLSWTNKKNNKYYLIQSAVCKTIINNLLEDELYCELINEPEDYHNSGFIYSIDNNDYLCNSSINGYINIWDLYNKNIFKVINTNNCYLMHIIQWSNKYIITANYNNNTFKIINLENGAIKDIKNQHTYSVICIKKIYHPNYGESLLSAGEDNAIKLWII